jgi:type IV pilus assembly protein PilC
MLFGHPSLSDLIIWCRAMGHGLDVGLSPVKILRQQATSGPARLRPMAHRVADRLETGDSLQEAFKPEAQSFPTLFIELIRVGEQSGRLPIIFAELEDHFETVRSTRREFFRMLIWPGIQYFGAIFVITLMLLVLGMLGSTLDPLGLGLTGMTGALTFFIGMMGFTAVLIGGVYFVATHRTLRAKAEGLVLPIPMLGTCFQAFALNRFCLAYHMTIESGMRADRCLRLSLRATANEAYTKISDDIASEIRRGTEVTTAMSGFGERLFPAEFMNALQIGEDTGRLAEVMRKQSDYYREEAKRKLRVLSFLASGSVYAMVGVLLIVMIFKIFTTAYLNPMQDAMNAADNPDAWMRQR